jgi:predicted MFS family arabinose efflux permease
MDDFTRTFLALIGIGAGYSVGKKLSSGDPLSWRIWIGDVIITGIAAIIAGSVLLFFPNAPWIAVLGVGAMCAIMGVTFVPTLVSKFTDKLSNKAAETPPEK